MKALHPFLRRQLKRMGLSAEQMPADLTTWQALLENVSQWYDDMDEERYVTERAFTISTREMHEVYARLRKSSEHELGRQQGELSNSLAVLHSTLDAMTEGVLVLSKDKRVLAYNRRFAEMWRLEGNLDVLGDIVELAQHMQNQVVDSEFFQEESSRYLATSRLSRVREHRLADGRVMERYATTVLDTDDGELGQLLLYRDVTAQRRAESALHEAKEAAERANRAKSDFLANMSHELRTPLNAIIGFARVLSELNEAGDPTQLRYASFIQKSGEHMLRLVEDLLDLRKVEEAAHLLELRANDVRSLVSPAVDMVRPLMGARKHRFEALMDDEPEHVVCDARALIQVLVNLLTNAGKYTPEGGRIRLTVRSDRGRMQFAVSDDGIGIAPEDQAELFTYFSKVGAKHRHHMGGSGVGLALTKGLVEAMGGQLSVESAVGVGSTFRFSLPMMIA